MATTPNAPFDTLSNQNALATSAPTHVTGYVGCENVWVNLTSGRSVQETNVQAITLDPPPYSLWNSAVTYAVGNVVQYTDGNLYIALQSGSNHNPATATAYWGLQPLQYYFDGETTYRNEDGLPIYPITGTGELVVGQLSFAGTPITSGANIYWPGGLVPATNANAQANIILSDPQAGIPPHPTAFLRTRVLFQRQDTAGTSMLTVWYWADQIKGISFSPEQ